MTVISGYAATFHQLDAQSDLVRPGAFRTTLLRRAGRIPLLWQHDITEPIGRILALREDARGLWFQAELPDSRRANDATALIRAGALRECSIGFVPRRVRLQAGPRPRGSSPRPSTRRQIRIVDELDLIEISLVTLAANPAARLLSIDGAPLDRLPHRTSPRDKDPPPPILAPASL